jgi:IS5 family transposase
MYLKIVGINETGRPPISPRVDIGALMIKHICHPDDQETVDQISENMYMQYFLGYQSFSNEAPFDASLLCRIPQGHGADQ